MDDVAREWYEIHGVLSHRFSLYSNGMGCYLNGGDGTGIPIWDVIILIDVVAWGSSIVWFKKLFCNYMGYNEVIWPRMVGMVGM